MSKSGERSHQEHDKFAFTPVSKNRKPARIMIMRRFFSQLSGQDFVFYEAAEYYFSKGHSGELYYKYTQIGVWLCKQRLVGCIAESGWKSLQSGCFLYVEHNMTPQGTPENVINWKWLKATEERDCINYIIVILVDSSLNVMLNVSRRISYKKNLYHANFYYTVLVCFYSNNDVALNAVLSR